MGGEGHVAAIAKKVKFQGGPRLSSSNYYSSTSRGHTTDVELVRQHSWRQSVKNLIYQVAVAT